jgi:TPR repeat protein
MYALGRGVQHDKEEAVRWYKKAAKQGLAEGIYNVAISYYNGEGVGADMVAAYAWMTLAQSKGDPQAAEAVKRIGGEMKNDLAAGKFQLALMYESGKDIPQDFARAIELYRQVAADDPGFRYGAAQFKLCQIYGDGEGVAQDYAQARSWCKLAAKRGNSPAYIVLGRAAEQGLGEPIDLREASDWYQNAATADSRDGIMLLGDLKLKNGSHDDQKIAYYWFFIAQKWKIPGADAKLQQASTGLTDQEIVDQQKKATTWLHESRNQRMQKIKLH